VFLCAFSPHQALKETQTQLKFEFQDFITQMKSFELKIDEAKNISFS
jgi:hypothetical protein